MDSSNNDWRINYLLDGELILDDIDEKSKGETKCVSEWSRKTGIARQKIKKRLESGWDVYDALTKPPMNKGGKKKSCHTNAN